MYRERVGCLVQWYCTLVVLRKTLCVRTWSAPSSRLCHVSRQEVSVFAFVRQDRQENNTYPFMTEGNIGSSSLVYLKCYPMRVRRSASGQQHLPGIECFLPVLATLMSRRHCRLMPQDITEQWLAINHCQSGPAKSHPFFSGPCTPA